MYSRFRLLCKCSSIVLGQFARKGSSEGFLVVAGLPLTQYCKRMVRFCRRMDPQDPANKSLCNFRV
jgi:hypothetical protein